MFINYQVKKDSFNRCAIDHLKLLLKDNKTAAVKHMKECFDTPLEESDFLAWLAREVNVNSTVGKTYL